jgi:hypothetical protein
MPLGDIRLFMSVEAYEVRQRKDRRGVDLISDALPFGRLWYDGPNAASNAIGYASQYSRSHDAVIRVYDEAGNVIENARARTRFPKVLVLGNFIDCSTELRCGAAGHTRSGSNISTKRRRMVSAEG